MGFLDSYRQNLTEKEKRFAKRHPGAVRKTGNAGTYAYPYIAYQESGAAAALEIASILAVVIGMGAIAALFFHTGTSPSLGLVLDRAACILAFNRLAAWLARKINYMQVRRRIVNDTDYAYYFAWKYPEQADVCSDLNAAYAANPDAVPAERFLQQEQENLRKEAPLKKWICIFGLGFLFLAAIALIAFCVWVKHETE